MTISDDVRAADSIAKIANEMAHYDWVMPPPIEIWAQRLQALADGRTACVSAEWLAELERDAGRWAFLRDHGHEFIDGITLHAWIGANRLRCGGWDKTIDAAIARANEAPR